MCCVYVGVLPVVENVCSLQRKVRCACELSVLALSGNISYFMLAFMRCKIGVNN